MSEVITFLAAPPRKADPVSSDGNEAVRETEKMMKAAIAGGRLGYTAELVRVSYVDDIARALSVLREPPKLIQIIGHGSPGRLQLGGYWGPAKSGPTGVDVLDSSPDSYGLLEGKIHPSTAVLLLGCSVGAPTPGGYVASGRALLFDLEDMLGCHAYAADGLVTTTSFPDDFLYFGSLVTSSGKPANPVGPLLERRYHAKAASAPSTQPSQVLTVTKVHSAVALGRPHATKDFPPLRLEATAEPARSAALFAMTEVELDTNQGRFQVICAGTKLRSSAPGRKTQYYDVREAGHGGDEHHWLARLSDAYLLGNKAHQRPAHGHGPPGRGTAPSQADRWAPSVGRPRRP